MEVITCHHNSDFDALASMLAAKKLYPDAIAVFPGSQERVLRDFLTQNSFFQFETTAAKDIDLAQVERIILVDTRQPGRIGRLAEALERPGVDVHIYDHHPPMAGDITGSIDVNRKVGATTTVMVGLLKEKAIDITSEEATVMMMGLYEETGCFTFISTTEEDLHAAAHLLSKGADLNIVTDYIVKEMTSDQISLLNEMLQSLDIINIGGVDIGITHVLVEEYKGDIAILAHKLRDMEGMDVLFVLAAMEGRLHIIARSRIDEVDAGEIVAEFGGGGHHEAASASIKKIPIVEAKERLINVLRDKVRIKKTAGDIMSFPVKTISSSQSIAEAGDLMARYDMDALPVADNGSVIGIISKESVSRARYHGLADSKVTDYMNAGIETLSPDAPLSRVRQIIIEHNQPAVPVIDNGRLSGIISENDILKLLHYETLKSSLEPYPHIRKKNIAKMMEERLPARVLEILKEAGIVADTLGFTVYTVGGFVRDIILKYENLDMDLVIEGDGIVFANAFAEGYGCRVKTHEKFGTAVLVFPDGLKVDVASSRLEYYERPAVLPTVERGSIQLDLYRRDFTINTLAVRLNPSGFGELLDYYGAQRDIREKVIRVLYDYSFVNDPTRVFRAIRFEQRFSFKMSRHTHALIANAVKLNFFEKLSGKRLFNELVLILKEERPIKAINRMAELGLLRFIHPRLRVGEKEREVIGNIIGTIAWYRLLFLKERCDPSLVYMMGLLDSLKLKEIDEFCIRLAVPGRLREKLVTARKTGVVALRRLARGGLKDSELYHLLKPLQMEALLYITAKGGETVKKEVSHYITHLMEIKTALTGNDLEKEFGLKPGPKFKEILSGLLDARLEGVVRTMDEEMKWVKRRVKG
ncbi:MAG: CBS domain-containing protein [Deltaproteobacteria bacterium]|nr:CBS domain-containing protein [Deltaproteobacteria bacterium]